MNAPLPASDKGPTVARAELRRAALLANTRSRRGKEWFAKARDAISAGGVELVDARAVERPREMARLVEGYVRDGVPLVVVSGGDGTFSAIAHLFAGKQTVLGVLPLGTGNSFARDLGIPGDLDAAVDAILRGIVTEVDMGLVGDRTFVNVATIGLSTEIALSLDSTLKATLGRAAYGVSLIRALATTRPFHVGLELPNDSQAFDCLQLVIGNGRFHAGPFPVTPDASITGGTLAVYALASRRKADFLRMALRLRGGKHVDMDEVKSFRVQSGKLSAAPSSESRWTGKRIWKRRSRSASCLPHSGSSCRKTPVSRLKDRLPPHRN